MAWGIKQSSNDTLRQKFVDQTVPQAEYLGLVIPDDDLQWDEKESRYNFGPIDWAEFASVLAGNGPCNRERIAARLKAWNDGAWFREGLLTAAHAGCTTEDSACGGTVE